MKRLSPLALAALPLAALAPGLAAASAPTVPTAGSAFATKLAELPASFLAENEDVMLSYVDMNLVWDRLGVGTDPADRLDALGQTGAAETFAQPTMIFGAWAASADEARAEVGFSMFEIEREAGLSAPPQRVIVVDTSVAATDVADAVATDPVWSADLQVVDSDAGTYWTWGDDPLAQDVTRRTPMRELGRGGALAVAGDAPATVIRTLDPAYLEATMRSIGGTEPSVADEGPFAPVVDVFGGAEVVQATGSTTMPMVLPPLDGDVDEIAEAMETATRFLPYAATTVVETLVDGEYHTTIVVTHFDPASAAANAETAATWFAEGTDPVTRAPLAELFLEPTITTDGNLMIVELGPDTLYRRAVSSLLAGALFPV